MTAKTYFVNQRLIFNLESMNDKIWCLIYDVQDGERQLPIEVAGRICRTEDDLFAVKDECNRFEAIAKSRKVTGKEYGRIKEIADWRIGVRYATCLANGMSEHDAGACWRD